MSRRRRRLPPSYLHTALHCRVCGYKLDAASTVDLVPQHPPRDGDVSLCMRCGEISLFEVTDGRVTGLREPNFVELAEIHREHDRMLAAVTRARAERGSL